MFNDECRAILEGRDGFVRGLIFHGNNQPTQRKRQQWSVWYVLG